jgi:hypothetical protein
VPADGGGASGMTARAASAENFGAGEGNRTLVISLEGFHHARALKRNSDKSITSRPLRPLANSVSSECAQGIRLK